MCVCVSAYICRRHSTVYLDEINTASKETSADGDIYVTLIT